MESLNDLKDSSSSKQVPKHSTGIELSQLSPIQKSHCEAE